MWRSVLDGRRLTFHLAGINNQNFIMRDEETGSWWQQMTGMAIQGPLAGRALERVFHDELTFRTWRRERPGGRVLRPGTDSAWVEFSEDWERETAQYPVRVRRKLDSLLPPRTVIVGVEVDGVRKAYPLSAVERQSPLHDRFAGGTIVLVLDADGRSLRGFRAELDGQGVELFRQPVADSLRLVDVGTASHWAFTGTAVSGPLAGRQLTPILVHKDYWFNWKTYYPETLLYALGSR